MTASLSAPAIWQTTPQLLNSTKLDFAGRVIRRIRSEGENLEEGCCSVNDAMYTGYVNTTVPLQSINTRTRRTSRRKKKQSIRIDIIIHLRPEISLKTDRLCSS